MQHLLPGQHPADHRGHPLGASVVSDGDVSGEVSWQPRSAATALSNDGRRELAAAPGLTPPVHHLDLELPLPLRLRNHGSRRDRVTTGVVGNGR